MISEEILGSLPRSLRHETRRDSKFAGAVRNFVEDVIAAVASIVPEICEKRRREKRVGKMLREFERSVTELMIDSDADLEAFSLLFSRVAHESTDRMPDTEEQTELLSRNFGVACVKLRNVFHEKFERSSAARRHLRDLIRCVFARHLVGNYVDFGTGMIVALGTVFLAFLVTHRSELVSRLEWSKSSQIAHRVGAAINKMRSVFADAKTGTLRLLGRNMRRLLRKALDKLPEPDTQETQTRTPGEVLENHMSSANTDAASIISGQGTVSNDTTTNSKTIYTHSDSTDSSNTTRFMTVVSNIMERNMSWFKAFEAGSKISSMLGFIVKLIDKASMPFTGGFMNAHKLHHRSRHRGRR
jgi:hypothetical protein